MRQMFYDIVQVDNNSILIRDGTQIDCDLTYIGIYDILTEYYACDSNPLGLMVKRKNTMPDGLDLIKDHNLKAVIQYIEKHRRQCRKTYMMYSE